jgi:acyl transferase domain-containing protein
MQRKGPIPVNPDIAIAGMAGIFPGTHDLDLFWQNIIHKVNTIREVSRSRWDANKMFDPELRCRDKIYSKWGGFLDDIAFDPTEYGIVPVSLKYIEAMQLVALKIATMAFKDAGMEGKNLPKKQTAVIFGSGGMHDQCIDYIFRTMLMHYLPQMEGLSEDTRKHIMAEFGDRLPEWTEDSFPGMLSNVISGRTSNRFDLQGSNFTVDAACASSLAALDVAIAKLRSGAPSIRHRKCQGNRLMQKKERTFWR